MNTSAISNYQIKVNQRASRLSLEAVISFYEQWIKKFAKNKNFQFIDDRPVLSILTIHDFEAAYGLHGFKLLINLGRKKIREEIGKEPFIIGIIGTVNLYDIILAQKLPLDGISGFGLLPDWGGPPIQEYSELIKKRVSDWYKVQSYLKIPFFPVVVAGWDASVRGEHIKSLNQTKGFPWRPIVKGVTSKLFGYFLDEAIKFNTLNHPSLPLVFLHAWNEWTESSVIEPTDKYGYSFLEEIEKRAGN